MVDLLLGDYVGAVDAAAVPDCRLVRVRFERFTGFGAAQRRQVVSYDSKAARAC